jgi:hypothetical protein
MIVALVAVSAAAAVAAAALAVAVRAVTADNAAARDDIRKAYDRMMVNDNIWGQRLAETQAGHFEQTTFLHRALLAATDPQKLATLAKAEQVAHLNPADLLREQRRDRAEHDRLTPRDAAGNPAVPAV